MIDQVDHQLRAWVLTVLGPAMPVSLAAPSDSREGHGVSLYLLDVKHQPRRTDNQQIVLHLSLLYLVTTWAEEPEESHRLLGLLILAALETADFEVQLDPIPISSWAALKVIPQPAFLMRLPLTYRQPMGKVPRVKTMRLQSSILTQWYGQVLDPSDQPISQAKVEVPSLHLETYTNIDGNFQLVAVPQGALIQTLKVQVYDQDFSITLPEPATPHHPIIVRLEAMEV